MKAAEKVAPAASIDAEEQLTSFIDKFDPKGQSLIRAVRKALTQEVPYRQRASV